MVSKALGLIETVGLVAALEAADAAVKAANIELRGYELTNGGGMVLVRLSGDVGAVKMAVEAGRLAAGKVSKVVATHVIPRPHQQLAGVLTTSKLPKGEDQGTVQTDLQKDTKNEENEEAIKVEPEVPEQPKMSEQLKTPEEPGILLQLEKELQVVKQIETDLALIEPIISETEKETVTEKPAQVVANVQNDKNPAEVCNFCHDPACQRKKGDPKVNCIHYGRNNEEAE